MNRLHIRVKGDRGEIDVVIEKPMILVAATVQSIVDQYARLPKPSAAGGGK